MPEILHEYEYEQLIDYLRTKLTAEFGSISGFMTELNFERINIKFTANEKSKMFTYLSLPVRTKSFPLIEKMYKEFLGIELVKKLKVVRVMSVYSTTEIKDIT